MSKEEIRRQNVSNIVSAILFLFGLYNQAAAVYGWPHFELATAELTGTVNLLYDLIVGAWIYWKNHPITKSARLGQVVINDLKTNEITPKEVDTLLNLSSE